MRMKIYSKVFSLIVVILVFASIVNASINNSKIIEKYNQADYEWIAKKIDNNKRRLKKLTPETVEIVKKVLVELGEYELLEEIIDDITPEKDLAYEYLKIVLNAPNKLREKEIEKHLERKLERSADGNFVVNLIKNNEFPNELKKSQNIAYEIQEIRRKVWTEIRNNADLTTSANLKKLVKLTIKGLKVRAYNNNVPAPKYDIQTNSVKDYALNLTILPYFQNQKKAVSILLKTGGKK